jgi:hypothetical protein
MKPIDIYAIGFEEMVDLDAKNIVNARYVVRSLRVLPMFYKNILEGNDATKTRVVIFQF